VLARWASFTITTSAPVCSRGTSDAADVVGATNARENREKAMNAIEFLKQEHQNAKEKFAEIEQASPGRRGELWDELKPELEVHEHVEDEFLYGPLSKDPKAKGTPLADFQKHQDEDVATLKQAFAELERQDPSSGAWLTQLKEIRDSLADHIKEEEGTILPRIPDVWPAAKLEDAGAGMQDEKRRKLREVPAK
jgi:iron-sulfur cluster repair protein YtfE (RIC family)